MLIDTHAHLNFHEYDIDREEVFKRALDNDIWIINAGANFKSSQRAVDYLKDYPSGVFAAIGIHPEHLVDQVFEAEGKKTKIKKENPKMEDYRKLANTSSRVVAIGEIGLDYYRLPEKEEEQDKIKNRQQEVFIEFMSLAGDLGLPVVLHCREAHRDMLEILRNYNLTGVAHSFAGSEEDLNEYLELGYYIGYNGIITFKKKAENIQRLVELTPLDKIILETDCPYLTPEPHRGKRNEPSYVRFVANKVAEIKGISIKEVEEATTNNAKELFNLERSD